jgi:uncharacterized membrane protein
MNNTSAENVPAKKVNVKYIVRLSFLVALMVLMSFTPVGYLKVGVISVSFLCLPVILGAILLGPLASTILGFVFGISSFIAAFSDPLGAILLGINPFLVFLTLVVPRILMGLGTGLIFRLFRSIKKTKPLSYLITSIAATLLNSILYTVFLWFTFGDTLIELELYQLGTTIITLLIGLIGFNTLLELLVCGVFGFIAGRIVSAVNKRAEKKKAAEQQADSEAVVHDAFEIPTLPEKTSDDNRSESEN